MSVIILFSNTGLLCFVPSVCQEHSISPRDKIETQAKRGKEESEDEYRMLAGACVLLVNGTFICPVTFPCTMIVYYRRNLFVRETPADLSPLPIFLKYCLISCTRCCFSGLVIFCLLHCMDTIF